MAQLKAVREQIAAVIVGQSLVVEHILVALLANGHCLLQGVPGLGKTLLLKTLAEVVTLPFGRIQFTPDLMPGDIIGAELLSEGAQGARRFEFQPGPVFTSLLLADEINRTPPKTQAALLEAMAEQRVTFAGTEHALPQPFFVMATQNPLEQAGTYPLPEAQLDRFLLMIEMGYPSTEEEIDILRRTTGSATDAAQAAMGVDDILAAQSIVRDVSISEPLLEYASVLIRATRPDAATPYRSVTTWVRWGAGPRAGQALVRAAKARALLRGRLAVTLEDVQAMAIPVLRHRVLLNFHAEAEHVEVAQVVGELLRDVPGPQDALASGAGNTGQ
ncbi:MAG: MoxR family ATPase [Pseudomonadota bacterium]